MYIVKLVDTSNGRDNPIILSVYHFKKFQNALAFATDKESELFENLPDDRIDTLGNPHIICGSVHEKKKKTSYMDDFELRYENGLYVYIGEPFCADKWIAK